MGNVEMEFLILNHRLTLSAVPEAQQPGCGVEITSKDDTQRAPRGDKALPIPVEVEPSRSGMFLAAQALGEVS
jgi:hypothetical protein